MDNALMVGLTRQMTLRRAMDISANNIANASTAGFKAEHQLLTELPMGRSRDVEGGERVKYVDDWGVLRDFRTGPLEHTARPLDVALQGEGFFAVETENGVQYTRDGRFAMAPDGRIVASDGAEVLDENGGPIVLDPLADEPVITEAGVVFSNGVEVGRLQVTAFDNLAALRKAGEGRFTQPENGEAQERPADVPQVNQGYYESSNVNSVVELTNMLQVTRTYQSVSKMVEQTGDLQRRAIEQLGKLQG